MARLSLLVLLVIVDLVIPKESLVPVAPEEVLCPQVLVRVLNPLLQRWQVGPVLPMLLPKVPRVDATEDQAWDDDAGSCQYLTSRACRGTRMEGNGLDGESSPQICRSWVSLMVLHRLKISSSPDVAAA